MKLERLDFCSARYNERTLISYSTEVAGYYDNVLYKGSYYSAYVLFYYNSATTCRHFHNFFKKHTTPHCFYTLYKDCQKMKKAVGFFILTLNRYIYISSDPSALAFFNLAGRVGYGIIEHLEG